MEVLGSDHLDKVSVPLPVYYNDCLTFLGQELVKESSILEKSCRHPENCHKIINCKCTPQKVCDLRDSFRDAQDSEARKANQLAKISEKEEARVKRYNNERERFDAWCKGMGWGSY